MGDKIFRMEIPLVAMMSAFSIAATIFVRFKIPNDTSLFIWMTGITAAFTSVLFTLLNKASGITTPPPIIPPPGGSTTQTIETATTVSAP